jgi:hypothetical protein
MLLHKTAGNLANGPDQQYHKPNGIIFDTYSKAESIMMNLILLINLTKFKNIQQNLISPRSFKNSNRELISKSKAHTKINIKN